MTAFETGKAELHDSRSDNMATSAGQDMVPTRYTHTCSSLAEGSRSGRGLCGKVGHGGKPPLFIMCNFHEVGVEKNMGHYCGGKPRMEYFSGIR